jgi:hypothetical protein
MLNVLTPSMRILSAAIALLLSAPVVRPADGTARDDSNRLPPDEQAAGFRLLFNGSDLTGWVHNGKPGSFKVRDGEILGDRTGARDLAYWLSTEREYADFELRLQYKLAPGGNSGVFIRAPHEGRTSRLGMEIQLLDDGGRTDTPGTGDTCSIYRVVAPRKFASRPAGRWNDLCILCDGDRIRVALNGEIVNDALMSDYPDLKSRPRKGYIGLSTHTGPVRFRNVRLRGAPAPSTAPASRLTCSRDDYGLLFESSGARTVLGYVTKKRPDSRLSANSACCLHPICTPAGHVVTDFAPEDHRHHRGAFLAWYLMEGAQKADFWGWGQFAPTQGRVIENRIAEPFIIHDADIGLYARNDWLADGNTLVREELTAVIHRKQFANVIDLTCHLVPTADIRLDRTAFGGFCVRVRKSVSYAVFDPSGEVTLPDPHYLKPETNWPAKDWYTAALTLDGGAKAGIAVIDHPKNPPATWHNPRTVRMLNPCITAAGPIMMKKNQPLILRYRVVAFDGPVPTDRLQALAAEWRAK